jgi:hypothetical protein
MLGLHVSQISADFELAYRRVLPNLSCSEFQGIGRNLRRLYLLFRNFIIAPPPQAASPVLFGAAPQTHQRTVGGLLPA